jgi:hypothetical protein
LRRDDLLARPVPAALGADLIFDLAGRSPGFDERLDSTAMLNALGPKPVSMSTSSGTSHTSVMRRTSVSTSSIELIPRSGKPSEPAATPPPER